MMTKLLGPGSRADFSGKYKGALESSSGGRMNVLATIRQQGDKVTGTIGPTAMKQAPFEDVMFTNGRLGFRIAPLSGLHFTFPEAGDTLSGTLSTLDGTQPSFECVVLHRSDWGRHGSWMG